MLIREDSVWCPWNCVSSRSLQLAGHWGVVERWGTACTCLASPSSFQAVKLAMKNSDSCLFVCCLFLECQSITLQWELIVAHQEKIVKNYLKSIILFFFFLLYLITCATEERHSSHTANFISLAESSSSCRDGKYNDPLNGSWCLLLNM